MGKYDIVIFTGATIETLDKSECSKEAFESVCATYFIKFVSLCDKEANYYASITGSVLYDDFYKQYYLTNDLKSKVCALAPLFDSLEYSYKQVVGLEKGL